MSRSKAGRPLLRSQVRKGLESLILTATSGATFSVLLPSTLLLQTDTSLIQPQREGVIIIAVMIITLLAVINEMENRQFTQEKYTPEECLCANTAIVTPSIYLFSGFVLSLLETELMPGATSNLSALSICSVDYT